MYNMRLRKTRVETNIGNLMDVYEFHLPSLYIFRGHLHEGGIVLE